jgi:hypothetical protein
MADPWTYSYTSPLAPYASHPNLAPLPSTKAADGKSYVNPPSEAPSPAYGSFADPITNSERGGFDVHVYFEERDEWQAKFARELWERVRRECKCFFSFRFLECFLFGLVEGGEREWEMV